MGDGFGAGGVPLEPPLCRSRGRPGPKALVRQEGDAGGSVLPPAASCCGVGVGGSGAVAYTSSPMRVTLAERKVCKMKTMGLGQECRSSASSPSGPPKSR